MEFNPSFRNRKQNDKIAMHCLKFLQVMADRNTELVNDFIMMVPVYPVAVGKQMSDATSQTRRQWPRTTPCSCIRLQWFAR